MSINIKKAGILTTVQDLGRSGFRRYGVNQNGAMDKSAVRLVNSLLANDENAAVLEMHFPAADVLFENTALFSLGGADFAAHLNGERIENWRIYFAAKGSTLKFSEKVFGNRAYLSIKGGFAVDHWLGSASTNLKAGIGGFHGRKIQSGDRIPFKSKVNIQHSTFNYRISSSLIPFYSKFPTVRVIKGAEFNQLTTESRQKFESTNYRIALNSDRMGFRLKGEPLLLRNTNELVSSAVNFGTIQLLPDGQMIVLMADHQTSGGYPRIANVIPTDLPLLAQLGAHDQVAFHLISVEEAENLLVAFEQDLTLLKIRAKFL